MTNPDHTSAGARTESASGGAARTVAEAAWAECEAVIKRFEAAWRGPDRPDLAAFAPPDHPLRARLLAELAHVDLELRLRQGEGARADDYLARFPELAPAALAIELIAAEFNLRGRAGPVSRDEFVARFPQYREALSPLLAPAPGADVTGSSLRPWGGAPAAPRPAIPGYEIEDEVGRGGMGVVYRARQPGLSRTVAVKTLRTPAADTRDRFRREAEAMARLDHPHIAPVYEVGEWRTPGGRAVPYFTMKWYPGGGLDGRPCGPGTDPTAHARVVETVARALHHAHQRGVLHRDLKPSNVLLDDRGEPHVADFGLAGLFDPDAQPRAGSTGTAVPGNTGAVPAVVLGTPSYMAPEQARNPSRVTTAADVYGVGAVLYHLLTGRPPFQSENPYLTLELVGSAAPPPPSAANPKIPPDLEAVCLKCLEKHPAARYPSAEAVADDLARFAAGQPVLARPRPAWVRVWRWVRQHPVAAAMGVVTLATLVASVGVLAASNARVRNREAAATAALMGEQRTRATLEEALIQRERALYLERVASAGRLYAANQHAQAWRLLADCPQGHIGWEWRYLDSLRRFGPVVRTVAEFGGRSGSMAVAPDGRRVVVGPRFGAKSGEDSVRVLDAATGQEQRRLPGSGPLAFHTDSRRLAAGRGPGHVAVWDAVTGQEKWSRPVGTVEGADGRRLAFSPDGTRLAVWTPHGNGVVILQTDDGTECGRLDTRDEFVHDLAFAPNGGRLAVAGAKAVTAWDTTTGTRVAWAKPAGPATAVAFARDGDTLTTADGDGIVRLRSADTGEVVREFAATPTRVNALAFSPDGSRLLTAGVDGHVRLWDVETGYELLRLSGTGGEVTAVAWARRGDAVFALAGPLLCWQPRAD